MRASIRLLAIAALARTAAACGKGASPPPAPAAPPVLHDAAPAKVAAAADAGAPVDAGPALLKSHPVDAKELPAGVKPKGTLEDAYTFLDAHGANYVLFSSRTSGGDGDRSKYLFVDLWLVAPGAAPRELLPVRDLVEHCAGEPAAAFHDLLDVGDLDHDGVAEVTIGYEVGCRTAPSPVPYKVLMLEDGVKYALRGQTRVPPGGTAPGGDVTPDPAFDKAPAGFLVHAKELWEKSVDDLMLQPAPVASEDAGTSPDADDAGVPDDAGPPAVAPPIPRFQTTSVGEASLPHGLRHEGDLDSAQRFDDAAGANYVLFSSKLHCGVDVGRPIEERAVWVDQYVVPPGGRPQKVASWTDSDTCPALSLEIVGDAFAVLDTDYDGVGEVVIADRRACYGSEGPDPAGARVVVLGDPPMVASGAAWSTARDPSLALDLSPDAGHWPDALLAYARTTWRGAASLDNVNDESAVSASPCRR